MWWAVGKTVLKIYGLLWMTAVGGILGSNLSATIGTLLFITENKGLYVQPWAHYGWYVGTALFFIGAICGKFRFINGSALSGRSKQPADTSAFTEANDATAKAPARSNEQSSIPGFVFACGLAGGFLGLLLGGSLLVFTTSYAYSPFASQKTVSSVRVVQEQGPGSAVRRPVIQNSHPVALYICLTPAVLGIIAGAVGGGVITLKYREGKSST